MEISQRFIFSKTRIEAAIWASKLALLVMGAISSATLFKVAVVPHILDLALSTLPGAFSSLKSNFSSPLYIYIAVNFVIAAIVVSSAFTHKNDNKKTPVPETPHNNNSHIVVNSVSSLDKKISWESFHILDDQDSSPEIVHVIDDDNDVTENIEEEKEVPGEDNLELVGESSLDDTWQKIITAKELKRSETFAVMRSTEKEEDDVDEEGKVAGATSAKEMRKSETFADRVSFRRDASISHEELGRRADAFIRKVNADMRLQRLESEQRFRDMVNRGL